MSNQDWPLYEVFVRSKQGAHRHVGSLHAADDQMAGRMPAMHTRRSERLLNLGGDRRTFNCLQPEDKSILRPCGYKVYRHNLLYHPLMVSKTCRELAMNQQEQLLPLHITDLAIPANFSAAPVRNGAAMPLELEIDLTLSISA
ncbi:hypothetical protein J4727_10400 [Providencia rettgeri]|uniref:Uncharacterized protein n=1 Tax=Providencia rettgeri TaxID=587 RepID=A0A939SLK8_PRORE|nr:hypothetical protein [Providencia rettgeri]